MILCYRNSYINNKFIYSVNNTHPSTENTTIFKFLYENLNNVLLVIIPKAYSFAKTRINVIIIIINIADILILQIWFGECN